MGFFQFLSNLLQNYDTLQRFLDKFKCISDYKNRMNYFEGNTYNFSEFNRLFWSKIDKKLYFLIKDDVFRQLYIHYASSLSTETNLAKVVFSLKNNPETHQNASKLNGFAIFLNFIAFLRG